MRCHSAKIWVPLISLLTRAGCGKVLFKKLSVIFLLTVIGSAAFSLPNLYVQNISFSSNPVNPGASSVITYTAANNGNATASNFVVNLYIDGGTGITKTDTVSSLAAAGTKTFTYTYSGIPATPNPHDVFVMVDANSNVAESNEGDNITHNYLNVATTTTTTTSTTIANKPPSISFTQSYGGTQNTNTLTFIWTGSDTDGSIANYYYKFDSNSWSQLSSTTTQLTWSGISAGAHTFSVKAVDNKGAESTIITASFTINSKPTVSITSGPSGTIYTSSATFTWSGSDSDGWIDRYEYQLDNGGYISNGTGTSTSFSGLNLGAHTFDVRCRDNYYYYSASASRSFTVATSTTNISPTTTTSTTTSSSSTSSTTSTSTTTTTTTIVTNANCHLKIINMDNNSYQNVYYQLMRNDGYLTAWYAIAVDFNQTVNTPLIPVAAGSWRSVLRWTDPDKGTEDIYTDGAYAAVGVGEDHEFIKYIPICTSTTSSTTTTTIPGNGAYHLKVINNDNNDYPSVNFQLENQSGGLSNIYSAAVNSGQTVFTSSYSIPPGNWRSILIWTDPDKGTQDIYRDGTYVTINAGDDHEFLKYIPLQTTTTTSNSTTSTVSPASTTTTTLPTSSAVINISVKKQDGTTLVSGAKVLRYSSGFGVVLDTVYSNAGGVASFTNVPAGTYDFEVYYNNEFWGNPSRQTVAVGNIRNLDFVRYMPYARSVKIDNSSLGLGDNGHVNIVVENPSLNLSNVKARFILDRNKSPGYDYDQWSSPQSIIPLTDTSYLFTFSPSATLELGDYYSCVEISTEVNNRYVETDSWPWSDAKLLTVSLSAEVFLQHFSGKVYHNEDDPIIYADELDDYTLVIRSPFSGEAELRDDSGFPKVFYHGTMTRQGNAYQAVYKFKASDLNWDSNDPAGNNFIIELHRSDNQDKPYYYYYRFNLRAFGRSRIIEELSIMEDALGALADFAANQGVDWSAKITVPFNAYNKAYLAAIEPTQYNGLQKIKITAVSAADPSAAKELIVGPSSIDFTVKDGIYTTTYSKQRIGQSLSDLPQINYQLEGGNVYVSPPAEKLSIGVTYGPEGFASAAEAENGEKYLLKNVRVKAAIQNDLKDTLVTGGGELLSGMLAALTLAEAVDLYAQGPQSTSKATATLASFGAGAVAGDAALSIVGVGVIGGICSAGTGVVVGLAVYYLVDYVLPHPTEEILSKEVKAGNDAYLEFPLINHGSQTHIYQAVIDSPLSLNTVDCTGTLPIIGSGCNVLESSRYSIVPGGYANIKMKFMPTTSTEGTFPITINFKEEESGMKWIVRGWVKVDPWQANSSDSSPRIGFGASYTYQAVKQNTSYLSYALTIESTNTANLNSVSITWPSLYYNLNGRVLSGLLIDRSQQYVNIIVPASGDSEILARAPSIVTIDNYWDTGFCVIEHNGEIVYQNGRIIDNTLVSSVVYDNTNHSLTLYVNHWDNYTIITDPAFLAPQIKTVLFDGKVLLNGDYVTARPMIEAVVEDRTAEALALKVEVFSFPAANSITSALVSMAVNSANGVSRSSLALAVPLTAGEYYACLTVSNEAGATSTFSTPNFRVASAFNFTAICGPNPFSPNGDGAADTTKISYQLSSDARIKIRIVGLDGRAVKNFDFDPGTPLRSTAGYNEVEWDGRDNNGAVVGNGLYLCYILADSGTDLIKQKLQIAVLR